MKRSLSITTLAIISALLLALAWFTQHQAPGTIVAVTLYKAHLLVLGGWGGYLIDWALFPYGRPHEMLDIDCVEAYSIELYNTATIRRAIIVAGALLCVGLGA